MTNWEIKISDNEKETRVTLKLSSSITGSYNGETNLPHKLLLTDKQVLKLLKDFENNLSANTKLLKTEISKIIELGGRLSKFLDH